MSAARKILIAIGAFVLFLIVTIALSAVFHAQDRLEQQIQDEEIVSEVKNVYLATTPGGEPLTEVSPGDGIFFVVDRERETPCYIDIDWRWTKVLGTQRIASWGIDGGRVYASNGHLVVAEYIMVPLALEPGKYTLHRVVAYDCGPGFKANGSNIVEIEVK